MRMWFVLTLYVGLNFSLSSCDETVEGDAALLQTRSDLVLRLPRGLNLEDWVYLTTITSDGRTQYLLHVMKRDSLWVYDGTSLDPVRALSAKEIGCVVFTTIHFNDQLGRVYFLDRYSNTLTETDAAMKVLRRDTLPILIDADSVDYMYMDSFIANDSAVITAVGANAYIYDFLRKPCIAVYHRTKRTWTPVAWFPKDMQDQPERQDYSCALVPAPGSGTQAYLRFRVSDTIYRVSPQGTAVVYVAHDPRMQYRHLDTLAGMGRQMEFYLTAPYALRFYPLPGVNAVASLCVIGNELVKPDGRRVRESDRRGFLLVNSQSTQRSFAIPDSIHVLSSLTCNDGEHIGLPLKRVGRDDPRIVRIRFFDMKASLNAVQ